MLCTYLDHSVNITNLCMKVFSGLIVALLVVSFPALAIVKGQSEDAVIGAAETSDIYARRLYVRYRKCVIYIDVVCAAAATAPAPFTGKLEQLVDE